MYKNIFVPIDGSPIAHRALREAIQLAKAQASQLRIVYVLDEISYEWVAGVYSGTPGLIEAWRLDATKILDEAREQAKGQGVAVETALLEKPGKGVAEAIVEEAAEWPAALVVMGTHGRKGLNHLLLGSVAEKVVRLANCPVLLAPGRMAA